MIRTEDLTKRFKDTLAVDRLTLDVASGEVFGFLGPNGAGKTTTVRLLTGLIQPTSGSAIVNGLTLGKDDTRIRSAVGLLTETPGLYDNLSAEYNLQIYARLYGVADPQAQVEKYLRLLGLGERRFELTATFSKGMKQKLAIARALLHEPPLVFLDEPTAALDPESAHVVREFITHLRDMGRTVFLCTHNLDEADRLCDRIGVFKGRLLVVDTPVNLRRSLFGRRVVFHLSQPAQAYQALMDGLAFISRAQALDNKLVLTLDDPEQRNPEIIRRLVEAGADIQFVGELRPSLEDVYLRLMKA